MRFTRLVFANFDDATLSGDLWDRVRSCADEVVLVSADSPEYLSSIAGADGLVLRLGMSADASLLSGAPQLRYIGMLGTDFGRIDIEEARTREIVVANIADYSTASVAEFSLGMALDLFRDFSAERHRASTGDLGETLHLGRELASLNVGVVGTGNLGQHVARLYAAGIGSSVSYWSRNRRPGLEEELGIEYLPLDELAAHSDLLSVNLALNPETEGILDADLIRSLPLGAGLINTSPNELVDLEVVLERCESGAIRYASDHGDELSAPMLARAQQTPNVYLYPPLGFATQEASRRKLEILVSNIEAFLAGAPTNHVNR